MSHGKLYMMEISPPVRSVLMTEKLLGINSEKIQMNMMEQEHLKPEYIKLNPQHTIPFYIASDGTKISDSHAIMIYLASKYAKNDDYYPKDLSKQSAVNHLLIYNGCEIFPLIRSIGKPIMMKQATGPSAQQVEAANGIYGILNTFLSEREWMAGDKMTLADVALIGHITTLEVVCPIDSKHSKLISWVKRCQQLPFYEANIAGVEMMKQMMESLKNSE